LLRHLFALRIGFQPQDCSGILSIIDDLAGLSMNNSAEHDDVAPATDDDNIMDQEAEEN